MDARIIVKFECMEPLPRLIFSGEPPYFCKFFLISVYFGVRICNVRCVNRSISINRAFCRLRVCVFFELLYIRHLYMCKS